MDSDAKILIAERKYKRNRWLYGFQTEEEKASEMPGAPIKVEIVGFGNVNPTSRRRRVGAKKRRAEQAFMNGAAWETRYSWRNCGFPSCKACSSI